MRPVSACDVSRRFLLSPVEDSGAILLSPEAWIGTPLESSGHLSGRSSGEGWGGGLGPILDHLWTPECTTVAFGVFLQSERCLEYMK